MPTPRPQSPTPAHWQEFFVLAEREGWRIPRLERELFAGGWSDRALVLAIEGRFAGMVTVAVHEKSGWIGNLLVPRQLRGRGYGKQLFAAAVAELRRRGMERIWLTASPMGRPLYVAAGFTTVERIERWRRPPGPTPFIEVPPGAAGDLREADRGAWGEARDDLLDRLIEHGRICVQNESAALLQPGADLQVIGPWLSADGCPGSNRRLLQDLLAVADPAAETVLDLRASSSLRPLLAAAGFAPTGTTELMRLGRPGGVVLDRLVALASLGSLG